MRRHLLVDAPLLAAAFGCGCAGLPWVSGGLLAAHAGIHGLAVAHPRCALYGGITWRLDGVDPALTFDDGPDPEVTPRLLDLLDAAGVRATFFLVGSHVRAHPRIVRRLASSGHQLGLHSDRHARTMPFWGYHRIQADLRANAEAIAEASGTSPSRWFRPPVGLRSPPLMAAAHDLGLRTMTWSVRGFDTGGASPDTVYRRIIHRLHPGAVVLLHDGHEPGRSGSREGVLPVVERLLAELKDRGLTPRVPAP